MRTRTLSLRPTCDEERWPAKDVARLKRLTASGMSYGRMARRLKRTRNQIIGKVHRLGIRDAATPDRVAKDNATLLRIVNFQRRTPGKGPLAEELMSTVWAPASTIGLDELGEKSCRWPVGDPKSPDFGFCGCEKVRDMPYCATHARVAYGPATDLDDDIEADAVADVDLPLAA